MIVNDAGMIVLKSVTAADAVSPLQTTHLPCDLGVLYVMTHRLSLGSVEYGVVDIAWIIVNASVEIVGVADAYLSEI